MPSASDLCKLFNKELYIEEFIETVIKDIELQARHGEKYTNVDIPSGLTRADIEEPLKNAFPECSVKWKWFIQTYRIRWA
jgi:hypothetical protein